MIQRSSGLNPRLRSMWNAAKVNGDGEKRGAGRFVGMEVSVGSVADIAGEVSFPIITGTAPSLRGRPLTGMSVFFWGVGQQRRWTFPSRVNSALRTVSRSMMGVVRAIDEEVIDCEAAFLDDSADFSEPRVLIPASALMEPREREPA
jgi:hypothetical protein